MRIEPSLRLLAAILCLIATFCAHHSVFDRIAEGDLSMIIKGRYSRSAVFLDEGGIHCKQVLKIRTMIEKHFHLMPLIAEKYYQMDREPVFTFKYVLYDTVDHCYVLRYFARMHRDPVLAGYEIFFNYDADTKRIIEVYTNEVPLE